MVCWGLLEVPIDVFYLGHAVVQVSHVVCAQVGLFESHAINGLVWVKSMRIPCAYAATM